MEIALLGAPIDAAEAHRPENFRAAAFEIAKARQFKGPISLMVARDAVSHSVDDLDHRRSKAAAERA